MSYLFIVEDFKAKPNPETLLISPFKEIWKRDKTKNKDRAIAEFSYIELFTSQKKENPYAGYEENIRKEKLKELYFDSKWKPDNLILEGIKKIEEFQKEASPTLSYYLSVKKATEKMKHFFDTVDINERNIKGLPVYKPAEITRALQDTDKILYNLSSMKDKVEKELFENSKTKANKVINYFEI